MEERTVQSRTASEPQAIEFANSFLMQVSAAIGRLPVERLIDIAGLLQAAGDRGSNIFFFGNGGSHSIATHLACDLGKGTKLTGSPRRPYRAISLDNAAWLTAQANDGAEPFVKGDYPGIYEHGYDGIFVGQMENFIERGDVAFAISSSGNSRNVVNGLLFAKSRGAQTIALVGFDGGEAARVAEHVILVATARGAYGVVEAVHEVIHHYLYEVLRSREEARPRYRP